MAVSFAVIKKGQNGTPTLGLCDNVYSLYVKFSVPQFNYVIFTYALFHFKKLVFQALL